MPEDRTFINTKIKKVMLLTWNPNYGLLGNLDLLMGYEDPQKLVQSYCDSIWRTSRHTYKYEIVYEETISSSPQLETNIIYPNGMLLDVLDGKVPGYGERFDYQNLMNEYEIPLRIASREIDEVWLMGHPRSGFHEAVMGGPNPIWLTGPAIKNTESALRRFVVMGFDYSQDLGAMLEAYIHRAEAVMTMVYAKHPPKYNEWANYTAIEKTHPNKAGVGTAHFAPNSLFDYDWKNNRYVLSNCDDWENYPNLKGTVKTVNHTEWGYGSRIAHHEWWMNHLPHGVDKTHGVYNNWWHYIQSPDWINSS
jgi:hypothetical protein